MLFPENLSCAVDISYTELHIIINPPFRLPSLSSFSRAGDPSSSFQQLHARSSVPSSAQSCQNPFFFELRRLSQLIWPRAGLLLGVRSLAGWGVKSFSCVSWNFYSQGGPVNCCFA